MSVCKYVHVSAEACGDQMLGFFSKARITENCDAPEVGAGNRTGLL